MEYYLIFCVVTTICIIFGCQYPGYRRSIIHGNKSLMFRSNLWGFLIIVNMLAAPIMFIVFIFGRRAYQDKVIRILDDIYIKEQRG